MRIAHVTDGYPPRLGGIELQVRDLALRQAAFGHDVEVVTMTPTDAPDSATRTPRVAVRRPHPRTVGAEPGVRLSGTWGHSALAVDGGYDLVHAHLSVLSPLAVNAVRRCVAAGVPVAVTVHSIWTRWPAEFLAAWLPTEVRHRSAWSGVSSAVTTALAKHAALTARVVPNGVDVDFWRRTTSETERDDALRLISAMRLTRRKRPLPLLRAIDNATDRSDVGQLALTIAGTGRLEGRVRSHGARARGWALTMAGQVDRARLLELFAGHSVYVAPARLESFGLAALEARSAGLPVVAWRTSGIADHVVDGVDALLVDSDRELAGALRHLATEPGLLDQLRQNCADPPAGLGWTTTLAGYDELYEQAVMTARRPGSRLPLAART